ncbi:MAG: mucoidy inhibitor MuiA family protein [Holophaga sp.]|nr:mucoidy inhibitor MuiA family protein [Holophaga sp.]
MRAFSVSLFSAFALSLAAQTVVPVEAPIARVRLHPDEAWITRIGNVRLEQAGTFRLEVRGLPAGLRLEDLRITAKGPEGARLGDISVKPDARKFSEGSEFAKLEAQREALRQQRDALETQKEALKEELAFLRKLMDVQANDHKERTATLPAPAASILELGKSYQARLADLLLQDRKLSAYLGQVFKEEQKLKVLQAAAEAPTAKATSKASIELSITQPGSVELTIMNRTPEARWIPSYEARLDEGKKRLELVLLASVSQRTPEDWSQVRLELSTARTQQRASLPRPGGAVEIGWIPPETRQSWAPPPPPVNPSQDLIPEMAPRQLPTRDLSMAYAGGGIAGGPAAPPPPVPALESNASITFQAVGLATTFALEGAKTVPADAQPHRFRVSSQEIKPDLALVTIPRENTAVFQVIRFQPSQGFPIFPGSVLVPFAEGQRLAETRIQYPRPGQPFELCLGTFDGLRTQFDKLDSKSPFRLTKVITRRQKTADTRTEEVQEQVVTLGKERVWTLDELVTLSNSTQETQILEVFDRIVRSTSERVQIALEAKPKADEISPAPFLRRWSIRLEPGAETKIQLGLTVRGPKEGTLNGLGESGFVEE